MSVTSPAIDPDQPLKAPYALEHDRLQRTGFARSAVSALHRVSAAAGFVLSIEGPWGSGKTSTLAMIEHLLQVESDSDPVLVHFNPWIVGDRDALLKQFLSAIAQALRLKDYVGDAENAANQLTNYADLFDVLKWVPGAEPWASVVKGLLKSTGNATRGIAKQKAPNLDAQKKKVEEALVALKSKIYVFIDDVDRLSPTEVFEIVRIIKAIGELPNVGYIVAWDPEYVRLALEAAHVPRASSYIDKIVQVRLPLPAISMHARLRLLNASLDALPAEATAPIFPKHQERLSSVYFHGMRDLMQQPRDITRVMNTLSVIEPGLRGEIVLADILGLACLMVCAPEFYEALRKDVTPFTKDSDSNRSDRSERTKKFRKRLNRLLRKSTHPKAARELIYHLFPAAAKASGKFAVQPIETEGHLAAPGRINIALGMSIGATDVSLVDAKSFIQNPQRRSVVLGRLSQDNDLGFLEMLSQVAKTLDSSQVPDLETLCLAIAEMVDTPPTSLPRPNRGWFGLSAEALAINAIRGLVLVKDPMLGPLVAERLARNSSSLTVAADVLGASLSSSEREDTLVVPPKGIAAVGKAFVVNVESAIRDGSIWSRANPARILWTTMRLGPGAGKRTFKALKEADPSLDAFALEFLKHAFSSDGGQSYCFPKDKVASNMVRLDALKRHATKRLKDPSVAYPLRAAWQSVVDERPLYGDGREGRF